MNGKTALPAGSPAAAGAALDQLGELPRNYGSDIIFLAAQEPRRLFTYWDIDISRHPGGPSFLRVMEGPTNTVEVEIEVPFEARNWYIPVQVPGGRYTVEIGYYRADAWQSIARSATIQTPPDGLSGVQDFDYATIPLHLSFHHLLENVQNALRSGESLSGAISRMQRSGDLNALGPAVFPDLADAQRLVLEALLGHDAVEELSSGSSSSEEVASRVRALLQERLASHPGVAGSWAPTESSLFSAWSALAGQAPSQWSPEEISSWATAAMKRWSPEELSSWITGALSSWSGAANAPTSGGPLASWFLAPQSSWAQAALSSWSQAATTSWSSWSGGSENVDSFSQATGRSFFLHVNAEVIFYGGTDPRAKVTIDGKPIPLNPDGSFRFHFVFPDGSYEIPIVATSPDGTETRSAVLRFERDTHRTGRVDDTPQPPLDAPMGAGS